MVAVINAAEQVPSVLFCSLTEYTSSMKQQEAGALLLFKVVPITPAFQGRERLRRAQK